MRYRFQLGPVQLQRTFITDFELTSFSERIFISQIIWFQWILLAIAALGIGVSKSGLSGLSMVHVMVFAYIFGSLSSTGVVLPMLIAGDICAMVTFGQHANWRYVLKMLPPSLLGVVVGFLFMQRIEEAYFTRIIGGLILVLTMVQIVRMWNENFLASVPTATGFSMFMGVLVGITTMMANAAGPVFALYLLSLAVPKLEFVGTGAWFFLILNTLKVPFSYQMGLIRFDTLLLNLVLVPLIPVGISLGKLIVHHVPQRTFNTIILSFTAIAAIKMMVF